MFDNEGYKFIVWLIIVQDEVCYIDAIGEQVDGSFIYHVRIMPREDALRIAALNLQMGARLRAIERSSLCEIDKQQAVKTFMRTIQTDDYYAPIRLQLKAIRQQDVRIYPIATFVLPHLRYSPCMILEKDLHPLTYKKSASNKLK